MGVTALIGLADHPNISWQITTEETTPATSATKPAASACRVRRTATDPK
jgi:hypothetical protein